MKEIGIRLRSLREGIGLSQMKLSKLIGTSQVSVNRYENGNGDPPLTTLLWYADYFDVSLDYIFGRTDQPQGKLYEYRPKFVEDNQEMKKFVDMCFNPNSSINERLKQVIIEILNEEKN